MGMMRLVEPHSQYEASFQAALEEMTDESDRDSWIYLGRDYPDFFQIPFSEYIARLLRLGADPPPHFVSGAIYWAVNGSEVIGRIGLRYELNDFLRKIGGHIGFIVRPSMRGQGVATEMVRQVLLMERAKALGHLLVTCDKDNIASERVIAKNGGQLESMVSFDPERPLKKRYWIHLNDDIEIDVTAAAVILDPVADFYRIFDYEGSLRPDDDVVVGKLGERIVGAVRLVDEGGVRLLRGMFVHNSFQRKGVGTTMLNKFEELIVERRIERVFLICGSHLQGFYGQIGFRPADDHAAPEFLRARRDGYRTKFDQSQMILLRQA